MPTDSVTVMEAEDRLSDGEVVSEEESEAGKRANGAEGSSNSPPMKRLKIEDDRSRSNNGDGATGEQSAILPSKKRKKSLKKRIRDKHKFYGKLPQQQELVPELEEELDQASARQLVKILKGLGAGGEQPPSTQQPVTVTTRQFQAAIQCILGQSLSPSSSSSVPSKWNKVVVVWLSMVSKQHFDLHFDKLKALPNSLSFGIRHPGTTTFAQLGLEAFLLLKRKASKSRPASSSDEDTAEFTKARCLLSELELRENGFPLPSQALDGAVPAASQQSFVSLGPWPTSSDTDSPKVCDYPMFAVDCEMVATDNGPALARISVVDEALKCVYDTLVKPAQPVTDYLSKFSGIDEASLEGVATTLADVQARLEQLLPQRCILIGHSLENDLLAMNVMHPHVIDTSLLFTPTATPVNKPSLRMLAKRLLDLQIQNRTETGGGGMAAGGGHDSTEDAGTCMKLVQLKLERGPGCIIPWSDRQQALIPDLVNQGYQVSIVDKQGVVGLMGKNATHKVLVSSDQEAEEGVRGAAVSSDFVFVQLHDLENYIRNSSSVDGDRELSLLGQLEERAMRIVGSCPKGSLLFVVCGSSNLRRLKQLGKERRSADKAQVRTVVEQARSGAVVATLV